MSFQRQHISTLAKYAGISFIACAVNHGMFSENRSYATAALGVVFFVFGSYLEMRSSIHGVKRWSDLLGFGILASIGLGFFTGGLQHFPDSPDRSIWVVPLGFFLSLMSLYLTEGRAKIAWRAFAMYAFVSGAIVVLGSIGLARYLLNNPGHDDHDHAHGHASAAPEADKSLGFRVVDIEMNDHMQFAPNHFSVVAGESIQFMVSNKGKLRHELVVGLPDELLAHAKQMKDAPNQSHQHVGNAVSVPAGGKGELLVTFSSSGPWAMACYEPGHYEAGMKGVIEVLPQK